MSVVSPQGLLLPTLGCIAEHRPILVPVEGDTASAHFRYPAPSGDVYGCDWELERTGAAG